MKRGTKKVLWYLGGGGAVAGLGYAGYRLYQSRQAQASSSTTSESQTPVFSASTTDTGTAASTSTASQTGSVASTAGTSTNVASSSSSQQQSTASQSSTVSSSAGSTSTSTGSSSANTTPGISSIAFSGSGANLKMVVTGYGFGAAPETMPFTGDVPGQFYFATVGSNGQWWSAGDGGTAVTLRYVSWSNTQIVVDGFSGAYGQNGWVVVPGNAFIVAGNALPNQYSGKLPSSDSPGPSSGEIIGNTYNSSSQVTSSSQVPSTAVSQSSYIDNPQAGDTYTFTSNGKTYEVTASAAQAAVQAEQDAAWLEQHPGATAAQLAAANP